MALNIMLLQNVPTLNKIAIFGFYSVLWFSVAPMNPFEGVV